MQPAVIPIFRTLPRRQLQHPERRACLQPVQAQPVQAQPALTLADGQEPPPDHHGLLIADRSAGNRAAQASQTAEVLQRSSQEAGHASSGKRFSSAAV